MKRTLRVHDFRALRFMLHDFVQCFTAACCRFMFGLPNASLKAHLSPWYNIYEVSFMRNDKLSVQSMDFAITIIHLVKDLRTKKESVISSLNTAKEHK